MGGSHTAAADTAAAMKLPRTLIGRARPPGAPNEQPLPHGCSRSLDVSSLCLLCCLWTAGRAVPTILALIIVRQASALTPGDLSRVGFEQHPGQQISRDLVFHDESGRALKLGELFGKQPLILVPGYYRCPMLCTMINDG